MAKSERSRFHQTIMRHITSYHITYWQAAAAFRPTFFLSLAFSQSYECVTSCASSSSSYCIVRDVM